MSITGKVVHISEEVKITDTFSKREVIVDDSDNPTYPNPLKIEFHKDKCSLLDSLSVGQKVTIEVNHRGREWVNPKGEKVYFNSINGWKIAGEAPNPTGTPQAEQPEWLNADKEDKE